MVTSQFADKIRCPYCSQTGTATTWPRLGDAIPFHYQTKEETEDKPGAYHVSVHCPICEKD